MRRFERVWSWHLTKSKCFAWRYLKNEHPPCTFSSLLFSFLFFYHLQLMTYLHIRISLHVFRKSCSIVALRYLYHAVLPLLSNLTFCAGTMCHACREFFVSKLQYFLSFSEVYSNIIEKAKQIINALLLNSFYRVLSYRRLTRKRRIIVYGLVTRYGPSTSCQRKGCQHSICAIWSADLSLIVGVIISI